MLTVGATVADLEVQVRAGGVAGGADIADVLSGGHGLAGGDVDAGLPHVRIRRRHDRSVDVVFDDDESTVTAGELRDGHRPVCCGEDGGAVRGGEVGAGVERVLPGERVDPGSVVRGGHPGARRQQEQHPRRLRRDRPHDRHHSAGDGRSVRGAGGGRGGEGGQDGLGHGLVVAIPVGIGGHLDGLGRFALVHGLPTGDIQQPPGAGVVGAFWPAEERPRLVGRVHEVGDRTPPGLRPHLEQAQAVVIGAVAVVGVVRGFGVGARVGELLQGGFGEGCHQRDLESVPGDPVDARAGLDDGRRMGELPVVEGEGLAVHGGHGQRLGDVADRDAVPGDGARGGGGGIHQHPNPDQRERRAEQDQGESGSGERLHERSPRPYRKGLSSWDSRNR